MEKYPLGLDKRTRISLFWTKMSQRKPTPADAGTDQDTDAPSSERVPTGAPSTRPTFAALPRITLASDPRGASFGLGGSISGDEASGELEKKD